MKNAPCKDCEKRELGCHARCEDYKEYRKQQDALIELRKSKEVEENWNAKRYAKWLKQKHHRQK